MSHITRIAKKEFWPKFALLSKLIICIGNLVNFHLLCHIIIVISTVHCQLCKLLNTKEYYYESFLSVMACPVSICTILEGWRVWQLGVAVGCGLI